MLYLFFLIACFSLGLTLTSFFLSEKRFKGFFIAFPIGCLVGLHFLFFLAHFIDFNQALSLKVSSLFLLTFLLTRFKKPREAKQAKSRGKCCLAYLNTELEKVNLSVLPSIFVIVLLSFYFIVAWSKLYFFKNGDLFSSYIHGWGDLPIHLAFSNSFLHGNNFPPKMPLLAGWPASYHFMADFMSAVLSQLKAPLLTSLSLPGALFCLNLVILVYLFSKKIAKTNLAASLSVLIFFLGGGLGFIYWQSKPGFIEYTQLFQKGIFFANITPAFLVPQKASLFGTLVCLAIFIILWENLKKLNYRALILASLLTGLLPLTFIHGFFVAVFFLGFVYLRLALKSLADQEFSLLKLSLVCWLPALVLALPQLIYFYPSVLARSHNYSLWHLFWTKPAEDNLWLFYFKNFGFFPLLLAFGLTKMDKDQLWFYFPAGFLFLLANLLLFQPTAFENIKIVYFWYLFSAPFVALVLVRLSKTNLLGLILAILLLASMTLSGAYDSLNLLFPELYQVRVFEAKHFEIADWLKQNTSPEAVFLTAPQHDHPVCSLAGRPIFLGFEGWLYTYGIKTSTRKKILEDVFAGRVSKKELLEKRLDYIYLGPGERNIENLNENFFQQNYQLVYQNLGVKIFKISN